ncbi:4-hydroxythreonine-4-phosphate dehydrogenase PdxA [Persephonella sp.]
MKYAITLGDPAGISPEILVKSADCLPEKTYVIYGSENPIKTAEKITGKKLPYRRITVPEEADSSGFYLIEVVKGSFKPGNPDKNSGRASRMYLQTAVDHILEKRVNALVTLPVSKEFIMDEDFPFAGHTDYLAYRSGVKNYLMMLLCEKLKVALATTHIPLREVPSSLNSKMLEDKLRLLYTELQKKFRIQKPVVAVLGLNPHAGDNGKIGDEEITVIQPVIDRLKQEGMELIGCLSADTAFINYGKYDAYFAMYHDQGLIPLKMLCFKKAVNITLGLPFIRTSPDHGTGFDIAGKNKANPSSFIEAVNLAVSLSEHSKQD